jgi:hypothetical protein
LVPAPIDGSGATRIVFCGTKEKAATVIRYLPVIVLATGVGAAFAQGSLVLLDPPLLNVDDHGVASAAITLKNTGGRPVALRLNLSDFQHKLPSGKLYPLGASYSFTPLAESDKIDFNSGQVTQSLHLKLSVARLWDAGQSTAVLKNGEDDIPTESGAQRSALTAIRIPVSYSVQIEGAGDATPEIVFSRGGKTLVRVLNNDAMNYRFQWQLRVGSLLRTSSNPYLDLPSHGSAYLDLTDAAPPISLVEGGTIKDQLSPGELVFQPILDADVGLPPIAPKILPLNLRLQFWSGGLQQAVNVFWVFLLLTLGGMTSIWVHCGMPNTTRALAMTRSVAELTAKLEGIGPDIASHSRVMLAGRLAGIEADLRSTWWIFPSFAATLDASDKELQMITEWVNVAYDVSMVLRGAREKAQDGIPPTVLVWIREKCNCALSHFESGFTTPDELNHMHDDLAAAQQYLTAGSQGGALPDLEREIQEREARLAPLLDSIQGVFPNRFDALCAQVRSQIGKPAGPAAYLDRDTLSLKVELLRQVVDLLKRAGQGAASESASTAAPDNEPSLLGINLPRALDYIRTDAPETLRLARLFVTEMRQGIYETDLLAEVKASPPKIAVLQDPLECDCGTPVHFSVQFHRPLLNDSAAVSEWTCAWDFGDRTVRETGWEVYHWFRTTGAHQITVSIINLEGDSVSGQPLTLDVDVGVRTRRVPWYRRLLKIGIPHAETMLEASRLAMVLTLAVIGLVGSAQHQAQSLTLLQAAGAVFALGFGADTLKNLIIQRGGS